MNLRGIRFARVTYPYQSLRSIPSMLEWIPVPGEIMLMDVTGATVADDHLQNVIRSIRQDFPVAVGIRLESPDVGRAMRMAALSCTAGARVVLGDDTRLNASLHESFAWPVDLSREIAEWFRMQLALSDAEAAWVQAVCRASRRARGSRNGRPAQ